MVKRVCNTTSQEAETRGDKVQVSLGYLVGEHQG